MAKTMPIGWTKAILGQLVRLGRPRVVPSNYLDRPFVGLEHIESQTMRLTGTNDAGHVKSSSILFEAGDILYGKMRPYLNKVWVAEFGGLCSAEFLVFPNNPHLNSSFLALRMNADDFVRFANMQVSGDRPRVDFEAVNSFPVLLPPLNEQARIVATLKEAFDKLHTSLTATQRASERLEKYRAAVLRSAVSGDLTQKFQRTLGIKENATQLLDRLLTTKRLIAKQTKSNQREQNAALFKEMQSDYVESVPPQTSELPPIPSRWTWANLGQLGFVSGGLTKNRTREHLPIRLPYLRVANVYANQLRLEEVETIGVESRELNRLLLEKGDLLIVEGNGSRDQIGRLAIWDGSIEKCIHQNHIIKVRLTDTSLGKWVLFWFLSPQGRTLVENIAVSTTGLYTLSINKVGALPIPLPPLDEQNVIVDEVERRLAAATRLAKTLDQQIEQVRVTRQSLLQEAFSGRLIPQDSSDEPALILLTRIRDAWTAEDSKPKVTLMKNNKLKTSRRPLLDVLRDINSPVSPEKLFKDSGFQGEFEASEYRQEIVDMFYDELRELTKTDGPVLEKRIGSDTVLLEIKK